MICGTCYFSIVLATDSVNIPCNIVAAVLIYLEGVNAQRLKICGGDVCYSRTLVFEILYYGL